MSVCARGVIVVAIAALAWASVDELTALPFVREAGDPLQLDQQCKSDTGGSCRFRRCDPSFGPTKCVSYSRFGKHKCICQPGFCFFHNKCMRAESLRIPAPASPSYQQSVSGKMCADRWKSTSQGETFTCRVKCCRISPGGDAWCLPVGADVLEPCSSESAGFTTFAIESGTPLNLMAITVCTGCGAGALVILAAMRVRRTWTQHIYQLPLLA